MVTAFNFLGKMNKACTRESMLDSGTVIKNMEKANVNILMSPCIKATTEIINSMDMVCTSFPQIKSHLILNMSMKATGKKVRWMGVVSLDMIMASF
jgi:hypothetical protein